MTLWSENFSYAELKSILKWESKDWKHIVEDLQDDTTDIHGYLSAYQDELPLEDTLREFSGDFCFYNIVLIREEVWSHVGVIRTIVDELTTIDESVDAAALLEEAKDKICETVWTDIPALTEKFRRVDKLYKSLEFLRDDHADVYDCVGVERELALLRLEAATDPWSKVQDQFSFGTLSRGLP